MKIGEPGAHRGNTDIENCQTIILVPYSTGYDFKFTHGAVYKILVILASIDLK